MTIIDVLLALVPLAICMACVAAGFVLGRARRDP